MGRDHMAALQLLYCMCGCWKGTAVNSVVRNSKLVRDPDLMKVLLVHDYYYTIENKSSVNV